MTTSPRSAKIQSILEARRPMAQKVQAADETLNRIESQIRDFKHFIPQYASRLDAEAASTVSALLPDTDQLLAGIAMEKGKLALLAGRYSRSTLNIGVVGQARQGKSQLLQTISGLSPNEIPSGDGGHCTGAPSIIVNHSGETFANLTFHSESSFLENVIQPFFIRLNLTGSPSTIEGLKNASIPKENSEEARRYGATETEHLKKLLIFQENIGSYKDLLGGSKKRIEKNEIRDFVAQENLQKAKFYKWIAVQLAEIYCEFPHADIGNIALADTPGLGDFQSGAEQRLAATIGSRLDSALMLRLPPSVGAIIRPEDTSLHDLIQQAVPDLTTRDWSHFVINTYPAKSPDVTFFESELRRSAIETRGIHKIDVGSTGEVAMFLDQLLNDISGTLQGLDQQLFDKQLQSLKILATGIGAFAAKAADALPKAAVVAPDERMLTQLFNDLWAGMGQQLQELVDFYGSKRDEPDEDFLATINSIFTVLNQGPKLPAIDTIKREAATQGLQNWHGHKLHELRVNLSNAFETIDPCLDSSFEMLRNEALKAFTSETGGKLSRKDGVAASYEWQDLIDLWSGHEDGNVITHAIQILVASKLSFRGFIQPRLRKCLNVLDSSSPDHKNFVYEAADTAELIKEKLELAWENVCSNCKSEIEKMANEPSMARFAAIEDFVDAVLRTGGEANAKDLWRLFYRPIRSEVWSDKFSKLEAETKLRKDWEIAVSGLRNASEALK